MYGIVHKVSMFDGDGHSSSFNVTNGVHQGRVLSPALFNLHIYDLSQKLIDCKDPGCSINDICTNHFVHVYADDNVLLAPSPDALHNTY